MLTSTNSTKPIRRPRLLFRSLMDLTLPALKTFESGETLAKPSNMSSSVASSGSPSMMMVDEGRAGGGA